MWFRLSVILFALALQASFPAKNTQTLHQRYGQPVSETFLIRPGVVVSASYGASGSTCELVISPKEPNGDMIKRWPGSDTIDYKLLGEIENELVPEPERGKHKMGSFLDIMCLPENDCQGTSEDWENIVMYISAGKAGARYEVIQWKRDECR
jgi:hypothetical protein